MIDLVAWDISGREIHGTIELTGARLGDALAAGPAIFATDVTTIDPEVGTIECRASLTIDIRRLVLVMATGPGGAAALRVPAVKHAAELHVGRYTIHGLIHEPATRGLGRALEGRPWLPVTDAVLERVRGGFLERERFEVVLVNRAHIQAILPVSSTAHELRWLAAEPAHVAPVHALPWAPEELDLTCA
jgi:hypothetical protein